MRELFIKLRRRLLIHISQFICTISPNKISRFVLPDGSLFDYPLKSAIGCELFSGGFERTELNFVEQSLQAGDVFFDVGANGGIFTLIAARKVGNSGHVYAFEPGLRELNLLRHNIAINNLANVTIIERAVSNKRGTTQFAISTDGAMNSLVKTNHPGQEIEDWQTVEMISLDDFVAEFKISKIDFIKIDVEGAEKLVFEGAKNLLARYKNIKILFEAADLNSKNFGYSTEDLLSQLSKQGFSLYCLNELNSLVQILNYEHRLGTVVVNFIATRV